MVVFVFLWLSSLGMIISRFIHGAANGIVSFFIMSVTVPLYAHTHTHTHTHISHLLYHSSISGHLVCLHVLTIVNSVAVNTRVRVFFRITVLSRYIPRKWTAESDGDSIFSFLRTLHTALHSGHTNLHFYQEIYISTSATQRQLFGFCF